MTLEFTRRSGANEGQGEVSRKNSAGWERGWEWMKFPPSLPRCNFSCCLWVAPHCYLARPDKGVSLGYLTLERSGPKNVPDLIRPKSDPPFPKQRLLLEPMPEYHKPIKRVCSHDVNFGLSIKRITSFLQVLLVYLSKKPFVERTIYTVSSSSWVQMP